MTPEDVKNLMPVVVAFIALATLIKAVLEYRRGAVFRRVEYFAKMRDEFLKDKAFAALTELLERKDPCLGEFRASDKWRYLFFFEYVALLVRARVIREELACYMFGYYALLCDRSEFFWSESFPKDRLFWPLFFDFVERMKEVEKLKRVNQKKFVRRLRS